MAKKRTTHRSVSGTKLYAVRDAKGRIKDIQTYKRAHGQDVKRKPRVPPGNHTPIRLGAVALVVTLALGLFAAPRPAGTQQPAKVPRIGLLISTQPGHLIEAFRQGLRELGYVESQNIAFEYRWAEGKYERLPTLAAELVRLKVDVIVSTSTSASQAAQHATGTIPIVMVGPSDPVADGLVASLARPGGNITGLSQTSPDLVGKQLALLKEVVPRLSRVAVLWNPVNPSNRLRGAEAAARALGVRLQLLEVRSPEDLDGAFAAMTREGAGGLLVLRDGMLLTHRARVADLAIKSRLPTVSSLRERAEAGVLMTYGPNAVDEFRRAATYVDKILKGRKPADLPVEQPTRFELVINLRTAKALDLTIPQSVLFRADHVIK